MEYTFFDLIGNVGVALIIISYWLLQIGWIDSTRLIYSIMNLFGAIFVIISLIVAFNFSAFIIEIFWVLISLVGIWRYFNSSEKGRTKSRE